MSAIIGSLKPWKLVDASTYYPVEKKGSVYSSRELFAKFLLERPKDAFKSIRYATFWAGRALSSPSVILEAVGKDAAHGKNWFSVLDLYKRFPELCSAVGRVGTEGIANASGAVLSTFAECFNSVTDGLNLVQRYTAVPFFNRVMSLNIGLTFLASSYRSAQCCSDMLAAQTDNQKLLVLLNLALAVSYVAFSSISLVCMALGTTPSSVVVVGCLTVATACAIGAYFFEKLNDPFGRNADVNWDVFGKRIQFAGV